MSGSQSFYILVFKEIYKSILEKITSFIVSIYNKNKAVLNVIANSVCKA